MQQLLEDPQTIPFANNNKINLGKLKKQIDRRMSKIRGMLGQNSMPKGQIISKINKASQTEFFDISGLTSPLQEIQEVLSHNISFKNLIGADSGSNERSSLPIIKKKHSKQASQDCCSRSKKKVMNTSQYLSIRKSLAPQSSEKNYIQKVQDDKIFDSKDFEILNGFNFRSSEHIEERPNLYIPLQFSEEEEDSGVNRSDCSSLYNRKKQSQIGSRMPSQKKNRFTDRTAAESENRFVVTPQCQLRMISVVQKLCQSKRRQAQDSKLRENIIKKIDEKYGSTTF